MSKSRGGAKENTDLKQKGKVNYPPLIRAGIYYAVFRPTGDSSVLEGRRPVVICQAEEGLDSEIIQVAPTSQIIRRGLPFLHRLTINKPSQVHYELKRPIHRKHIGEFIRELTPEEKRQMNISLSLVTGTGDSNFLLVERVKILSVEENEESEDLTVNGVLELQYKKQEFSFSFNNFIRHMGVKGPVITKMKTKPKLIQDRLDSIRGLKFLYNHYEGG